MKLLHTYSHHLPQEWPATYLRITRLPEQAKCVYIRGIFHLVHPQLNNLLSPCKPFHRAPKELPSTRISVPPITDPITIPAIVSPERWLWLEGLALSCDAVDVIALLTGWTGDTVRRRPKRPPRISGAHVSKTTTRRYATGPSAQSLQT